ncbi:tetratricopeptide repeat protein [Pontibacter sp. G13]|uniref:tetratricopeptide repeat protein n=1 Tax=Pontibacter sp. G13 TaxID=3074898 RepID=UPI002889CE1B|nr:tetratricopeptide repeat protein [Pontibacter sp. G13]WNJ21189.1 tetratricopeptide repeat protein [Pontibacter sp. G13]
MASKLKDKQQEEELMDQEVVGAEGSSVEDFVNNNRNLILGGLAVVVLAVVGLIFLNQSKERQNTLAHSDMFKAVKYFEQDSLNKALNGDGVSMGFLDIADEYGSTAAGNQAQYYIGVAYARQGKLDEAIDALEGVSASGNMLAMARDMALGFAYEDKQDFAKAARLFLAASKTPGANDQTTPSMLMNAARAYEANGDFGDALELYETIKEEYPFSQEGLNIDKYIGRATR